jgi:hypothetical protein
MVGEWKIRNFGLVWEGVWGSVLFETSGQAFGSCVWETS